MKLLVFLLLLVSLECMAKHSIMSLNCPEPKIVNKTDTWNENDKTILEMAKKRCSQVFYDNPCLIILTKHEERVFEVTCGKEK